MSHWVLVPHADDQVLKLDEVEGDKDVVIDGVVGLARLLVELVELPLRPCKRVLLGKDSGNLIVKFCKFSPAKVYMQPGGG